MDCSGGYLIEFLPDSEKDWRLRVEEYGIRILGCGQERLNLILRDTLLRNIYFNSSNRALVELFASHRVRRAIAEKSDQLALAHYLDLMGPRSCKSYYLACRDILGNFSEPEISLPLSADGDYGVSIEDQKAISEKYRGMASEPNASPNTLGCHNAFAIYTLLLLIAATGHRRSNTPFFFAWDFSLEKQLVFICDKLVIGSEARFVPLAKIACQQLREYLRHLRQLRALLQNSNPEIADHISSLIRLQDRAGKDVVHSNETRILRHSFFFTIGAGGKCKSLTTSDIDDNFKSNNFKARIENFRNSLADALWRAEMSGIEVSTLLGHSNELHPFGPSSNWTVLEWANRIRPKIDDYLDMRGWLACKSPLVGEGEQEDIALPAYPRLQMDNLGYEARSRDQRLAAAHASQVLRTLLPDEVIKDPTVIFDDEKVAILRKQAEELIPDDPKARSQVLGSLTSILGKARLKGTAVTAATINLVRTEPSPVEISFGRYLSISTAFRRLWIQRVGSPIAGVLDTLERAAQYAISLVVLEGILDPRKVQAITMDSLTESGRTYYSDAVVLRGELKNTRFQFEYAHIPETIVTAQLFGLQRKSKKNYAAGTKGWADIQDRVKAILAEVFLSVHGCRDWNIDILCKVFRPFWFIQFPGPIYAITNGTFNGPAANVVSESGLLGQKAMAPVANLSPVKDIARKSIDQQQKEALICLRERLKYVAGVVETGTANARSQNKRFKTWLDSADNLQLEAYRIEQPIVDAIVSFIDYLRKVGGVRKPNLVPQSILTYASKITERLLEEGWNCELEEWSANEFDDFYRRVRKKVEHLKSRTTVKYLLDRFHDFLCESIGAPYLTKYWDPSEKRYQGCRATLFSAEEIDRAFDLISHQKSISDAKRSTIRALLYIAYGYGLRRMEAFGLVSNSFDSTERDVLIIQRNVIRDLKGKKYSRRIIPGSIARAKGRRSLLDKLNLSELSTEDQKFLFDNHSRDTLIQPIDPIVRKLFAILRKASGNSKAVLHDVRHTYATRLALAALPQPVRLNATENGRKRIGHLQENNSLAFVRKLTNTPNGNPFVIEGIARLLGHKSIDNLLNVYFNCAYFVHAEYIKAASVDCSINDGQLAGMLGVERSNVPQLRGRLRKMKSTSDGPCTISNETLVQHYINKAKRRSAKCSNAVVDIPTADDEKTVNKWFDWVLIDRLLCLRKDLLLNIDELVALAAIEHGINEEIAKEIMVFYRDDVIRSCGFDDFEPVNSELTGTKPKNEKGLTTRSTRRQRLLAQAQAAFNADQVFRESLKVACHCWISWVNGNKPWLIARNAHDFKSIWYVLKKLGVSEDQLNIKLSGTLDPQILEQINSVVPDSNFETQIGLSRSPKNIRNVEVGINLSRKSGSSISSERDLHRLFAILSCCVIAISSKDAEAQV